MATFPVRNLVQGGASNKDKSPNSLAPNEFNEIINGRVVRGRIERFGGTQVFTDAVATPEIVGANGAFSVIVNGAEAILVTTDTACYYTINGSAWLDITPAAGWASTNTWNVTQYADFLILTSLGTIPFVLVKGAAQLVPFTNWPANFKCQKMVPYKNFLIALGVTIDNNVEPGLVKWSDTVDPDFFVDVAWDPADPTTLAGENPLPDKDGLILDGGVLRDSLIIYTDESVWRADPSGAAAAANPLVFNFRKIFSDDGIYKNRAFVEVNGAHYVAGVFDIYRHDGFNKASISDNRYTEFFYGRVGNSGEVFVSHYQRPQEIIFNFSVGSNSDASEALVYNYFYDTWTRWVFEDPPASLYTHFFQGPDFALDIPTFNDWTASGILFSDLNNITFNDLFPQNRNRVPYILGKDTLYRVDVGGTTSSVTPAALFIERRDLDMDELFEGSNPIKYISKFLPLLSGDGQVRIQFGGRNALSAPIVWQPERVYTIGVDYKFDLRLSVRYPAFRIIQDPSEGTLAIDGYDIHVKAVSRR